MTDTSHHCHGGGNLVGDDRWMPADPLDYYGATFGLFVGCNRLACTRCGQSVRHAVGYWEAPRVAPAALYAAPHWDALDGAGPTAGAPGRLYACACHAAVAHAPTALTPPETAEYEELPPWRCAGHPALTLPGAIAGLTLARPTDWDALVAAQAAVAGGVHPSVDALPGFALTRIYRALDDARDREALGTAVGARGGDPSPRVRQGVALFFALNPAAAGLEQVLAAWQAEPSRYDALPSPWGPQPALRSVLLEAIACRLAAPPGAVPDPVALAALRWAATHPPGLGGYLYRLPYVDADWAASHVDLLVGAAPADWEKTLRAIRVAGVEQLIPACRVAIGAGHATRDRVVAVLAEVYGRDAVKPVVGALAH